MIKSLRMPIEAFNRQKSNPIFICYEMNYLTL